MNPQWISKEEAGVRLGSSDRPLSPRRVLELAKEGRLQSELVRDPNSGQMVTRINAGSVERFIYDRDTPAPIPDPAPDSLPAAPQKIGNNLLKQQKQLLNLVDMVRGASGRLFLTIDGAAEYSGLGAAFLRRQIADGKLPLLKGAGIRGADVVRRADLEKL